jgi:DNA-binding NtrC family response regulator
MPLPCQARLLATLRDGTATPIGSLDQESVDVRVIATSHEDLEQRVAEGSLRADLLRKLGVLELTMTPLRSRPADLAVLFEHFMRRFARGVAPKMPLRACAALRAYVVRGKGHAGRGPSACMTAP